LHRIYAAKGCCILKVHSPAEGAWSGFCWSGLENGKTLRHFDDVINTTSYL